MAVVQSYGVLKRVGPTSSGSTYEPSRSGGLDTACCATYAAIYRTQPNVRTVVDYVARNVAQVPLHTYRRVSATDRVRLIDHELAAWLDEPNPDTTTFRLIESTMQDLGIYGMGFWLKVRLPERIGLMRLAPMSLVPLGWLMPTAYEWTRPDNTVVELDAGDVVAFRYYNSEDPLVGLSPLETLRQVLVEDAASSAFRRAFWTNSARLEGVITRPATAKVWTPEQKQSFREQWQTRYAGAPGQVAVLEDGMTFTATSYSARESEFVAARKLTAEEVTRAYHVPLPMVGILDHATFSNIREQHKHLYQDCLGPTFEMLQQELTRQLLPECDDRTNIYLEFNVADKLKGSFEEQSNAMRMAVGRPWMTANEGRARFNLPASTDPTADELALPLNLETPSSGAPVDPSQAVSARVLPFPAHAPASVPAAIRALWDRQHARLDKLEPTARAAAFDVARWDHELTADLEQCYRQAGAPANYAAVAAAHLAARINTDTLQLLVRGEAAFSEAREAALYV
jgi:HK97 family phage portal protein